MGLIWPKKAELLNNTPDTSCVVNVGDLPQVKINLLKLLLYYCSKPLHMHTRRGKEHCYLNHQSLMGETERTVSLHKLWRQPALHSSPNCPSAQAWAWGANRSIVGGCRCRAGTSLGSGTCAQGWLTSLPCCSWEVFGLLGMASWKARTGSWPLCMRAAGMHGLCLGMEDELAESLQVRISGQTNRGDLI